MKSKKSFLSLGIIVLVLFLGVGYAVVSSVYLNIGGTASVANADLKVEITNAVASTTVASKVVDFNHTLSTDKLSSNFTLNGMELNETVSITYTVTNNETDVDAVLTGTDVDLTNSNSDFFDVDYEITDAETDLENDDKTMEVVVNVSLIQTPVTESEGTTTVGLKLTASPKGGDTSSGSGTEVEATEIYYNQPYNAVVSTETVASDTATYARNGQEYNVTNLYNNVSELQVNARTLADTANEIIKTLVVYDDLTVEVFIDGLLSVTYPSSSVVIEGQTLNVTDGFSAQISSDFKTITIGEEVYELNTFPSSLKVGPEHFYFMGYPEDTPGQLMAMGIVFKDNTYMDAYFNGNLFSETLTEYHTVGNIIYFVNNGETSLYGYVSLDGTQIVSKGNGIFTYQGKDELYYGRAYTTLGDYDGDTSTKERITMIPYRDGSVDVVVDYLLKETLPAGTTTIENNELIFVDDDGHMIIENDGYGLVYKYGGNSTGYGCVLENVRARSAFDGKYNLVLNGVQEDVYILDKGTYTIESSGVTGRYISSDKGIILEIDPFVLEYDESTGIFSRTFGGNEIKFVPVE